MTADVDQKQSTTALTVAYRPLNHRFISNVSKLLHSSAGQRTSSHLSAAMTSDQCTNAVQTQPSHRSQSVNVACFQSCPSRPPLPARLATGPMPARCCKTGNASPFERLSQFRLVTGPESLSQRQEGGFQSYSTKRLYRCVYIHMWGWGGFVSPSGSHWQHCNYCGVMHHSTETTSHFLGGEWHEFMGFGASVVLNAESGLPESLHLHSNMRNRIFPSVSAGHCVTKSTI